MIQSVIDSLKDLLPPELVVFAVSVLPILELRGGLVAASILGIDWIVAFPICVLGNMLPIPFLLFFLKSIFAFLKKHSKCMARLVNWLENRASRKSGTLDKYKLFGLFLLVAIPLPGTGAWTGALVANAVDIRVRNSFWVIFLGVIAAGVIMSIISYLIPGMFF